MSSLTIKERQSKLNKLSNSLNITLIKGEKKDIQYMVIMLVKVKTLKQNLLIQVIKTDPLLIVVNYILEYYLIVDT